MAKKGVSVFTLLIIFMSFVSINEAIGGGQPAGPHQYPFVASIRRFGTHYCGASIVNENYLVTVAHCIFNQTTETIDVVTGTNTWNSGGTIHKIKEIIIHELYHYETDVFANNDIGLLVVENPIALNHNAGKLSYPKRPITPNTNGILVGWGRTSQSAPGPESDLQTLQTKTITDLKCVRLSPRRTLTYSNFCTLNRQGQGGCYGDSGTPLVDPKTHDVLGLYSWVIPPCGTGLPDGYTKMWEYIDWIKLHTGN